jgi:hypothetical protein
MARWFRTKTREHMQSTDFFRTFKKFALHLLCAIGPFTLKDAYFD